MRIRQLEPADLPAVFALQREAYRPELHEPESSFANKRALFPRGALGCFDGERLRGYAFVLPWRGEGVVPLSDALDALPRDPDTIYVHDVAVSPGSRGLGVGRRLLDEVLALGRALNLTRLALVAVQGSETFWSHQGFEAVERFDYAPGVPATRMVGHARPLSRPPG